VPPYKHVSPSHGLFIPVLDDDDEKPVDDDEDNPPVEEDDDDDDELVELLIGSIRDRLEFGTNNANNNMMPDRIRIIRDTRENVITLLLSNLAYIPFSIFFCSSR